MHPRAARLIAELDLAPHPEGGYFREFHRSKTLVRRLDGGPDRAAMTTIFFLLPAGEVSRWHRVASDEVWHFYEGAPLDLMIAGPGFAGVKRHSLGPPDSDSRPAHVVPALRWQAAESRGAYTLAGCSVGPGFDFADFALLRSRPEDACDLFQREPGLRRFL